MSKNHRRYWLLWLLLTLVVAGGLAWVLLEGDDKTLYMPGPLSDGHHQFADKCDVCHTSPLGGGEVLQQACIDCHGEDRVKPHDSHPRSKFTDPRNADRLEQIDARFCVTCHVEHKPEITRANGVTQPQDVCFHCHQDIGEDRPSHKDMEFATCASAGCHNYHNNRAIYTDFLVKHMDAAALLERRVLPARGFADSVHEIIEYPRDRYPLEPVVEPDAMDAHALPAEQDEHWLKTRHAQAGVNCSACHVPVTESGEQGQWMAKPGQDACVACHQMEVARFGQGKHGMRPAHGLSPMQVADARLPMQPEAAHQELTCSSCHKPHQDDVAEAAVDGCLTCHADQHSLAYKESPHYQLWLQELAGTAPAGSGVSCATCHMPRVEMDVSDWVSRTVVDHNQSGNLAPNTKMIRSSCLHCHGLPYAIDALADSALIDSNFKRSPQVHVDSTDLARAEHQRYLEERKKPGD